MKTLLFLLFCLMIGFASGAQDLVRKANDFLESLPPDLKKETVFEFDDEERYNFGFVPRERKGPTFHDFNEEQKSKALALLRGSLSEQGYQKVTGIMELEKILIVIENNRYKMPDGSPMRDPLNYHFSVFGKPGNEIWGWRFEGHHVSFNFVSNTGIIVSSTPSFMGSNPGVVPIEPSKGKEVLKQETEIGFQLVNSFTGEQLAVARFSEEPPSEIITGNRRDVKSIEPMGIFYPDLNEDQKEIFMRLLDVFIDNYQFGFAATLREKIQNAGLENLSFAWAGSMKRGAGHYYRIQGPMLLIEYANTQNDANHVHTVVRDLGNDFGEDILRRHYENDH